MLAALGCTFRIAPSDIDEAELPGEQAIDYVRRLARDKALALDAAPDEVVIAADTTVDVDGAILAKPHDAADARRMLRLISGREHRVHTAVAVRLGMRLAVDVDTTTVIVEPLDEATLDWYIGTGEPFGKAGAYAIQRAAAVFISATHGNGANVVGLPLPVLNRLVIEVSGRPLWAFSE